MLLVSAIRRPLSLVTMALGLVAAAACTKSNGGGGGGPVTGPEDAHCAGMTQATNQPDCSVIPDAGTGTGGGSGAMTSDYGVTMYNSEGDDDDCKYHVKWSATPIAENQDVTFTVTATYKATGTPNPPACSGCPVEGLTTQNMYADVFLDDTHPAPPTDQVVSEVSPGTYTIGPIQFDAPGQWTVRFHFFELCADILADSPHGHAAFYVDVP